MEIEISLKEYTYSSESGKKLILRPNNINDVYLEIYNKEDECLSMIKVDLKELQLSLRKLSL